MALLQGVTNALSSPAATPDGQPTPNAQRMGKYNELYVGSLFPTKALAALAGSYYSISITGTAAVTSLTALTEASPLMIVENSAQSGGPNIMLDFVRIRATAIMAAAVDWQYGWKLDNIRGKWGSAGSAITPQNCNMGSPNASVGTVHFGALVVATAQQSSNNARLIQTGFLTTTATAPAQIIGDCAEFRFGALEAPLPTVMSNVASAGAHTFAVNEPVGCPPVILPPGTTATLFVWGTTGGTAPSYEMVGGWYEY